MAQDLQWGLRRTGGEKGGCAEERRKWLLVGQASPEKWDAPVESKHGRFLSSDLLLQLLCP